MFSKENALVKKVFPKEWGVFGHRGHGRVNNDLLSVTNVVNCTNGANPKRGYENYIVKCIR